MLEILSRHHDMFVGYVLGFGVNPDTAQDIVQEFYLKMHDYKKDIMIGEEINFYFVYLVLRNMVFDLKKKEKRFYFTDEIPSLQDEEYTDIDTTKSEYITQWLNDNNVENLNPHNTDNLKKIYHCLLYTSPSPRDRQRSRMPSSA